MSKPKVQEMSRRAFFQQAALASTTVLAAGALSQEWSRNRTAYAASAEFELFRVGIWSGMPNVDPEQNAIRTCLIAQNWLMDPLLWRDEKTNELIPYLATEYSFIGHNTWRFKLREGVKFHNGNDLTAESVQFTVHRRLDEKLGSPNRKSFLDVLEVKVVDRYTADFVCKSPFPTLIAYLPTLSILDKEHYSTHPKEFLALNPMGSGPFRLEEFKPDDILRAVRNDEYWGQKPPIKKLEAPVILEDATRVAALLAGDLHLAARPTVEDFDRINRSQNARITSTIGNRIVFAGLNYAMEPFHNKKVRQALNYAVNQEEINEIYLKGMGEVMASALPSTVLGHDPELKPYPYDPAMAKQLLKEAGYPNGFKTKIELVPEWMIAGLEVTQAIANYLKEVGIQAELQVYDAGTLASRITSKKSGPIYMVSWGGSSTFDGDSYLEPLLGQGAFSNSIMPEVDAIIAKGRMTVDRQEREALYRQACKIAHEEAPWIFLHLQPNTYGVSRDHTWEARPDEMMPLWYIKKIA